MTRAQAKLERPWRSATQHDATRPSEEQSRDSAKAARARALTPELNELRLRRLQSQFARVVAALAEDLTGAPVEGDDEWAADRLLQRAITHESLGHCRQAREKETLVIVLDTSRSCRAQAMFYAEIAKLAAERGDVEVFLAPNASIESTWRRGEGWRRRSLGKPWPFKHRVILFFGDFDGGDAVVEASRDNRVYWFSCEERFRNLEEHSHNAHSLQEFKGHYWMCRSAEDFSRLVRRLRG